MENYYYDSACESVGMKRGQELSTGKLDAAVLEKPYRRGSSEHPRWKHVAVYVPLAGTKRAYEQPEDGTEDKLVHKRYKCNYWEDPACARSLELCGGRIAKHAAEIDESYRFMNDFEASLATQYITRLAF
jgi:hypothetical protein